MGLFIDYPDNIRRAILAMCDEKKEKQHEYSAEAFLDDLQNQRVDNEVSP
jgi:hypothetical protein